MSVLCMTDYRTLLLCWQTLPTMINNQMSTKNQKIERQDTFYHSIRHTRHSFQFTAQNSPTLTSLCPPLKPQSIFFSLRIPFARVPLSQTHPFPPKIKIKKSRRSPLHHLPFNKMAILFYLISSILSSYPV